MFIDFFHPANMIGIGFLAGFIPAWFSSYVNQPYSEYKNPLWMFREFYLKFPGNTLRFFFGKYKHTGYGHSFIDWPWSKR